MKTLGLAVLSVLFLLLSAWAALALWFHLPDRRRVAGVALWMFCALALLVLLWCADVVLAVPLFAAALALLLLWWHSIRPSNDRVWADEVARQLVAERDGARVTLHNVRNFAWRTTSDYGVRWETRRYDLDRLRSVDTILSHWMGPAIAHTLVSFGFDDGHGGSDYLTFSLEIRKERGELYTPVGGFFKKFEINLIAADERDIVRLRSNVRGEDVYLYRVLLPPAQIRSLFNAYLEEADALRRAPRWYNTATANCTTIVFQMMRHIVAGLPLDHRLLLSGYLPEYIHAAGGFTPGVDLAILHRAGRINERARAADADPAFSRRIREGVPGIAPSP
ncbi:MAG: DUF4105 domain-containing protein [Solimonas sp.]